LSLVKKIKFSYNGTEMSPAGKSIDFKRLHTFFSHKHNTLHFFMRTS